MNIEPLEPRIAPASLIFTDRDGDIVTLTVSKGTLADLQAAAGDLSDNRLQSLNLTAPIFQGANVSIIAKQAPDKLGDGHVHVGEIRAYLALGTSNDLGSVVVDGDLGFISAGRGTGMGLKSLTVLSMGHYGTITGASATGAFLDGDAGTLTVQTDLENAAITAVSGPRAHHIGSIVIGGSLIGVDNTSATFTGGQIRAASIGSMSVGGDLRSDPAAAFDGGASITLIGTLVGDPGVLKQLTVKGSILGGMGANSARINADAVGRVTIGGDVQGGAGADSGSIQIDNGAAGAISIGGSLIGGGGAFSGTINANFANSSLTTVKIGHDVIGTGADSGSVLSKHGLKSISLGGDLIGGTGSRSGRIEAGVEGIGTVTIRHHVRGGVGAGVDAGEVHTTGGLGTLFVGGDVIGGAANRNGLIQGEAFLTKVTVIGDLLGGTAGGNDKGTIYSNGAIGTISIGGDVTGGTGIEDGSIIGKSIKSVTVGGDVKGGSGSLSGSIFTIAGQAGHLGAVSIGGNLLGGATNTGRIYSDGDLASLKIGGNVEGADANYTGYIEAGRIGSVSIVGSVLAKGTAERSNAAQISARADLGSVTIGGRLAGNENDEARITATGSPSPTATTDLAIGKVKIGHEMDYASIIGGMTPTGAVPDHNAQLGTVTIGGSIRAAHIYAGTPSSSPSLTGISRIASVIVAGTVDLVTPSDIAAHTVVAVKLGDAIAPLTSGANTIKMGDFDSLLIVDKA